MKLKVKFKTAAGKTFYYLYMFAAIALAFFIMNDMSMDSTGALVSLGAAVVFRVLAAHFG